MPDKIKMLRCKHCGERYDYIPAACLKCGNPLGMRMTTEQRKRIENMLNPPDVRIKSTKITDRKIVICDRCGERFDYIPETCPKCGEILEARMDPEEKQRIIKLLQPLDSFRKILISIYVAEIVCYILLPILITGMAMPPSGDFFGFYGFIDIFVLVFISPLIISLLVAIFEKTKRRCLDLHFPVIIFYVIIPFTGIIGKAVCFIISLSLGLMVIFAISGFVTAFKRKKTIIPWVFIYILVIVIYIICVLIAVDLERHPIRFCLNYSG